LINAWDGYGLLSLFDIVYTSVLKIPSDLSSEVFVVLIPNFVLIIDSRIIELTRWKKLEEDTQLLRTTSDIPLLLMQVEDVLSFGNDFYGPQGDSHFVSSFGQIDPSESGSLLLRFCVY